MRFRQFFTSALLIACAAAATADAAPQYVINISVDGLGSSYLNAVVNTNQAPNFRRLQLEGVWTNNARNDFDDTTTLANHTTMITARGMAGAAGHNWDIDSWSPTTAAPYETLHQKKGSYLSSVFDVAHDNGLSTALFANKSKFALYQKSYNATYGAPDTTGEDNGTNKIDTYLYNHYSDQLVDAYLSAMSTSPTKYSFLHLRDPDEIGHASGWGSAAYNDAIKKTDGHLGRVLNLIETSPALRGNTLIVLTADHGGRGTGHSTIDEPLDYTIPFYAWGPDVGRAADLYALNPATRANPGGARPPYSDPIQPIRNGDMANASLGVLGLPAIPGSTLNAPQNLVLSGAAPALPLLAAANYFLQAPTGAVNWTPGADNVELGFATAAAAQPSGSTSALAATYDSSTSPFRVRMRNVLGTTTFATVDLAPFRTVTAAIDVMVKTTTYEADDYFRAELVNQNGDTLLLAGAEGTALNPLATERWLHYTADIPGDWTKATLRISSSTDSSTGAEAIDFDNIEFSAATPRLSSVWQTPAGGSWADPNIWSGDVPKFAGDTATFTEAGAAATITLDGKPVVARVVLNSAAGYAFSGGASDELIFSNGINSRATITVDGTAGSHEIAAPMRLLSDLEVGTAADTTLTISGPVRGPAALIKSQDGTLVLSGGNEYTGGTVVSAGILQVAAANGLPPGGSLTIDAGGTVVLSSGLAAAASSAAQDGQKANAVPEPTMLVLLATGALGMAAWLRRGRKAGQQSVRHTPCAAVAQQ